MMGSTKTYWMLFVVLAMVAVTVVVVFEVVITYPKWSDMAYALPALSCLTAGLGASQQRVSAWWPIAGFIAQALGIFVLLNVVMVGGGAGSFAWTFGFWLFGALIWGPAYFWFFAIFTLIFRTFMGEKVIESGRSEQSPRIFEKELPDRRLR